MKITGNLPIHAVYGTQGSARRGATQANPGSGPAAQVQLSQDASWISALREEARSEGVVRTDVVEETRAQLAAGTLDADVDLDAVVDNLLADL